jgi:hypothetical protein
MFFLFLYNLMLLRIWIDRLDPQQFEDISNEMKTLHKSMKNLIEVVFATSPLLALSTQGWATKNQHRTYMLRVSDFLVFFLTFINDEKDICSLR